MIALDLRLEKLKHWLTQDLHLSIEKIEVASADASFRRYFRVSLKVPSEIIPTVFIAMDSPPEYEDNELFINCSKILSQSGINVPEIFKSNIELGFLIITDLGSTTYQSMLNTNSADLLYKKATDSLIKIQTQSDIGDLPSYSAQKLESEMSLFNDWYIKKYHDSTLSSKQVTELKQIKCLLTNSALEQPQTLVHRDYHCRNLMICDDSKLETPGIIDYQDMVVGPITYDLVSLFKDCYIEWSEDKVEKWVISFFNEIKPHFNLDETSELQWLKWFDWMGIQRHLKVLGIFCRLNIRDGKNQYMSDLPLTYKYLINTCDKYSELHELKSILEQFPVKERT